MKVCVVLGTRPEIIKMSPVIRELERKRASYFILHTGQHYSYNLDRVFFEQLQIPQPAYNLEVGSGTHAEQTARILVGIEKTLALEKPDVVLVQGDTNSVMAAALSAAKLRIKVGHVEAGLRSYDRRMPEEINRIVADHIADYLFAPTDGAGKILLGEGIPEDNIFVTGNTAVDSVYQNIQLAQETGNRLQPLGLLPKEYVLVTLHRQENVDDPARFQSVLRGLSSVAAKFGLPVIYPVHPHSRKRMAEFNLSPDGVKLVEPVDFLTFLQLESNARLVLTDSGGVQEESCILGVPCVTLRDNTERPETTEVGGNILAGADPVNIMDSAARMLSLERTWLNPFGDGRAAERIVAVLSGLTPEKFERAPALAGQAPYK